MGREESRQPARAPSLAGVMSVLTVILVSAMLVLMAFTLLDSWRTQRELVRLAQKAEERAVNQQEQVSTLLREFRASVRAEEASRRNFKAKADAIIEALGAQVERLSGKDVSDRELQHVQRVLAAAAGPSSSPRRVVGQAGGAPRSREPPSETREPESQPDPPAQAQPAPAPDQKPPLPPEQRAEHQSPRQDKPKAHVPPPQRQPPQAQTQTQPDRPGNANPSGKAKGRHKEPPGKAKGR